MSKKLEELQWKLNEYRFVLNNPNMFAKTADPIGVKYYYMNRIEQVEEQIRKEREKIESKDRY